MDELTANNLRASTALNIYFLHKLGGEVVIDRAEFERIVPDYSMSHSRDEKTIIVRLRCMSGSSLE